MFAFPERSKNLTSVGFSGFVIRKITITKFSNRNRYSAVSNFGRVRRILNPSIARLLHSLVGMCTVKVDPIPCSLST